MYDFFDLRQMYLLTVYHVGYLLAVHSSVWGGRAIHYGFFYLHMTKIQYYSYISHLITGLIIHIIIQGGRFTQELCVGTQNHSSSPRRYTKPGIRCNKRDRRYENLHFLVPTVIFQDSRSSREGWLAGCQITTPVTYNILIISSLRLTFPQIGSNSLIFNDIHHFYHQW